MSEKSKADKSINYSNIVQQIPEGHPDVEPKASDDIGNEITEVTCNFCGTKNKLEDVLESETIEYAASVKCALKRIEETAVFIKVYNALWNQIQDSKINLYAAIYRYVCINTQYTKEEEAKPSRTMTLPG